MACVWFAGGAESGFVRSMSSGKRTSRDTGMCHAVRASSAAPVMVRRAQAVFGVCSPRAVFSGFKRGFRYQKGNQMGVSDLTVLPRGSGNLACNSVVPG